MSKEDIDKIEFYSNDVRILRELGHEVVIAQTLAELLLVGVVEVFYVWWWNRALAAILLARFHGVHVVICGVFDYFIPCPNRYDYVSRPGWQRFLMRRALREANTNIFVCQYEHDLICRFFSVNNPKMIYLAVDEGRYPVKTSAPESKRLLNISWSGEGNAQRKGLFELIEALPQIRSRHPEATLVMAGRPGAALQALRERAGFLRLGGAVQFIGELSMEDKVEQLQRASLYVQPSIYEGFGSAVAEAMACGTPVACTLAGSLPEVMGSHGVAILGSTPQAISEAVIAFLDLCDADQHTIGANCATWVRRQFSYESRKEKLASVLRELGRV
ncbi:MAG: glycosyltransferase [Steroidobacteraceae bacterium]